MLQCSDNFEMGKLSQLPLFCLTNTDAKIVKNKVFKFLP